MATRTINIFLASSDELINDRNSFHSFIATLDDIYESRGIRIKLKRWEDFSAYCTGERTQDDYNKVVRASDMCIAMFHRKAGKFTIEEFHQALDEYKSNKEHPKTYVYARVLVEGETEEQELTDFKKELFERMGHYWCNYATDDSMKLHFVMQFERYITPNMEFSINPNMKVENGVVKLQNREIARYENLPFAFNNEQYIRLKDDIAREEAEIIQLRSIGNTILQPMINEKIKARDEKRRCLEEIERNLFDTALYISKLQCNDKPMSERKRRAIELFEQGKNREATAVLNEDEIAEDARRATDKIVQGKALIEVGNELYEKGISEIKSLIDEYILRAKSLMSDTSNDKRLELSCRSYENAINLAEANLERIEYADLMNDYGRFLFNNCQYHLVEKWLKKSMSIYLDLYSDSDITLILKVGRLGTNIGKLYHKLGEYSKAEDFFKLSQCQYDEIREDYSSDHHNLDYTNINWNSVNDDCLVFLVNYCELLRDQKRYEEAKEIYKSVKDDLEQDNTFYYQKDFYSALVSRGLGQIYFILNDYSNSEKYLLDSLNTIRLLLNENPSIQNKEEYISVLTDLGNLYMGMYKYDLAERYNIEAYNISRQLADIDSGKYSEGLADRLNNLSLLYFSTENHVLAEETLKEALSILRHLKEVNPKAYTERLATSLLNLGFIQISLEKYTEVENTLSEALSLFKSLMDTNDSVYINKVANVLLGFGQLYQTKGEIIKSIDFFKESLSIYHELYNINPNAYVRFMAEISANLYNAYININDLDLAKRYICEASNYYRIATDLANCLWEDFMDSLIIQGDMYLELEEYENAERAFKEALQVGINKVDNELSAGMLTNLAIIHCNMKKYALAEKEFNEALDYFNQLTESDSMKSESVALVLNNLGELFNETENYEKAQQKYNEALAIYKELEKNNPGEYLEKINTICAKLTKI